MEQKHKSEELVSCRKNQEMQATKHKLEIFGGSSTSRFGSHHQYVDRYELTKKVAVKVPYEYILWKPLLQTHTN